MALSHREVNGALALGASPHRLRATVHRVANMAHRVVATLQALVHGASRVVSLVHRMVSAAHPVVCTPHGVCGAVHRSMATTRPVVVTVHRAMCVPPEVVNARQGEVLGLREVRTGLLRMVRTLHCHVTAAPRSMMSVQRVMLMLQEVVRALFGPVMYVLGCMVRAGVPASGRFPRAPGARGDTFGPARGRMTLRRRPSGPSSRALGEKRVA